jgi:hypothetical protein
MPLRIKLTEGQELLVDVDLEEWNRAFQRATANHEMVEIQDSQGRILAINPQQVMYLEQAPEAADRLEAAPAAS